MSTALGEVAFDSEFPEVLNSGSLVQPLQLMDCLEATVEVAVTEDLSCSGTFGIISVTAGLCPD